MSWKQPLRVPMFVSAVAEELIERNDAAGEKAQASDTPFRFSSATDCSRKLALRYAGFDATEKFDTPALVVTERGTLMHELVQEAIEKRFPGALFEGKGEIPNVTSGHYDALIEWNGVRYLWELKNVGGFAYDKAVGIKRQGRKMTSPEGPRLSAVIQGGLNALAHNADVVIVAYIATEAVSVQLARTLGIGVMDRIMAEWLIPREVWEPLALAEVERLRAVKASVDEGIIPAGSAVDDKGEIEHLSPLGSRVPWRCSYCSHRFLCDSLPAQAVRIEDISDEFSRRSPVTIGATR